MEIRADDPEECPTLQLVTHALAGCRIDDVAKRVGCLVVHPRCYGRDEARKRLLLSCYRFDQAIDDLRWALDLPPKGALARNLLLLTLGHATHERCQTGSTAIRAGASLAVRYVHSLPLPARERGILACIVDPSVGTYEATGRSVGRSRTVVRRATRHLRLFFGAPRQGQLILKVLHGALTTAQSPRSPVV